MNSPTRALFFACCVFVYPASAELKLDFVELEKAPPQEAQKVRTGLKVRAGGGQGGTPMHWMAFNGDEAGVRDLIIAGADIDSRVKTGATPLHLAAYNGHTEVARLLIEHGAQVNARTRVGITPLDWAQRNGHEEVARLLIAYGGKATKAVETGSVDQGSAGRKNVSGSEDATPVVVRRRTAPLNFSLMQLPEDSVAVIDNQVADTVEEPQPAQNVKPAPALGYRIQLGAFGSKRGAEQAWSFFVEKFPKALGGRELILDEVSVKGKTFHRVQTGPMSRSAAWEICGQLKKSGQSCAVMKRGPS